MIVIKRAILHIIDIEAGSLICSDKELDLKEYAVIQYIDSVIDRIEKAEFKKADGSTNLELSGLVLDDSKDFVNKSIEFAQWIFDALALSEDAASGDLLVFELADTSDMEKLGFIKITYKPNYTHLLKNKDNQIYSNIVINKTVWPSKSQKIEDGLIIDLETLELEMVEKSYKFEGNKRLFLSEHLLQMETEPTVTSSINLIKNIVKKVSVKYNEEQFISMSRAQQALYLSIEENGSIDSDRIADYVFRDNLSAKKEFKEYIQTSRFRSEIEKNIGVYENKLNTHKFNLSHDVKLQIPTDVYGNTDIYEFVNNQDGTINIVIKNVSLIESKF